MNYTKSILDQNISLKKENAKLIYEKIELKKQINQLKQLRINGVVFNEDDVNKERILYES